MSYRIKTKEELDFQFGRWYRWYNIAYNLALGITCNSYMRNHYLGLPLANEESLLEQLNIEEASFAEAVKTREAHPNMAGSSLDISNTSVFLWDKYRTKRVESWNISRPYITNKDIKMADPNDAKVFWRLKTASEMQDEFGEYWYIWVIRAFIKGDCDNNVFAQGSQVDDAIRLKKFVERHPGASVSSDIIKALFSTEYHAMYCNLNTIWGLLPLSAMMVVPEGNTTSIKVDEYECVINKIDKNTINANIDIQAGTNNIDLRLIDNIFALETKVNIQINTHK